MRLAATAAGPLDGAWWPRSRDLAAELPALTDELDRRWGRITRIAVNPSLWSALPRQVPATGHLVKVGWFGPELNAHQALLRSYAVGRWDLLVIPPETEPDTARRLMAAATEPGNRLGAGLLMAAAGGTAAADADRESVWESEGGRGASAAVPEPVPGAAGAAPGKRR
ncbi:hypothetical protein GCM10027168_16040 [Streptomyces capparidis]